MALLHKELDPRAALLRIEQDIAAAEQRLVDQRQRIGNGRRTAKARAGRRRCCG